MYPWERISPETDTTLRIIHEAASRGHVVAVTTPTNLTIRETIAHAFCSVIDPASIARSAQHFYKSARFKKSMLPLSGFDVIFMRANPPLDTTVLNFLDSVKDDTFICNDINGLRIANNKIYSAALYDPTNTFIPQTHVSKNQDYLEKVFMESEQDQMILKPLNGYGGQGVIIVDKKSRSSFRSLLDFYLGANADHYVILQEFVPGAEKGDVRILMLNGEPIGAMKRVPAEGEARSNISTGGTAVKHSLTKEEKALCQHVGPKLVRDGLYFVGLDVINGKLIEVNVLSPGGITRINRLNKTRLQSKVLDFVESVVVAKEVLAARKTQYRRLIEDVLANP
jgi:glutathione synthase